MGRFYESDGPYHALTPSSSVLYEYLAYLSRLPLTPLSDFHILLGPFYSNPALLCLDFVLPENCRLPQTLLFLDLRFPKITSNALGPASLRSFYVFILLILIFGLY